MKYTRCTVLYRNIHVQVVPTGGFELRSGQDEDEQLNVIMLSLDSQSRLSFMRHGHKLHSYLTKDLG